MVVHDILTVLSGVVIGFSLGLTGGGGSIFAVPLLIYLLGVDVRTAVGVSLAAVGTTSLLGAAMRLRSGNLEFQTGLLFAVAGMLGAPVGTRIGSKMPDALTLSIFALLMLIVGFRMWSTRPPKPRAGGVCVRDEGILRWNSRCAIVLAIAGFFVGVLSGVFGVGGGFIIVPALMIVSGMAIHKSVATSLMVIALICVSGVASYFWNGEEIPLKLTALFLVGGVLGMFVGSGLARQISGPTLKRVFAVSMWFVALFVLSKNLISAS